MSRKSDHNAGSLWSCFFFLLLTPLSTLSLVCHAISRVVANDEPQQLLSKLAEERRVVDDTVLGSAWEEFRTSEPSKNAMQSLRPDHLVLSAGLLGAELCFVSHYPTFTSKRVENGKVYDPTNPTISRLAGSGFNDENTFWLDLFSRRRNTKVKNGGRFQPRKHAEPALLQHHLNWLDFCLQATTAKVVVVFGKQNEEHFRGIWGDHKGISLWMLYPEGDDTCARIERIVLFV